MAAELWEIRDFIAEVPAFAKLPVSVLEGLPRRLTVRYLRRGYPFPPPDAERGLWIVRSGALTVREADGSLREKLAETDLYLDAPHAAEPESLAKDSAETPSVAVVEDSLLYQLPLPAFEELLEDHPVFAWRFERSRRERLERALKELGQAGQGSRSAALISASVDSLLRRAPVTASPDTSIGEGARIMTEAQVSALLLLEDGRLLGLVTDRDLRRRVIATGVPVDSPLRSIMTEALITVPPTSSAFEASLLFSRHNVHHLPVVAEDGALVGILSTSDLLRHQGSHSIHLVRDAMAAPDLEAIARVGSRLPDLEAQLVAIGADAEPLGEAMVTVTDAMTRRLTELAEQALGPAPVAWAWAALGSQGRREQTAFTDQDNALILDEAFDPASHGEWFERFARFVTEGLAAAGLEPCPGGTMATTPDWRQSVAGWVRTFRDWIEQPEPHSVMLTTNFFDMRVVAGRDSLLDALWDTVRPLAVSNTIFQRRLADNALAIRMPLGFFRRLVVVDDEQHDDRLDLKRYGLMPIADLARLHAVSLGLAELHTVRRLQAASAAGDLSAPAAAGLADAWRLFYVLRARHQAAQVRRGEPLDNRLDPERLSGLERDHLRDAFRVVDDHQRWLRAHFDVSGTR
ncbi:MAG: CBS domain-containing protein [Halothiobacillaceae bacterium]|nr:CBS domain-containing protein [Halothiobacillaceae bacterium]HER35396.1 CBS domain-containing protein [Halothiobacillaceae bacterium]